MTIQLAQQQEQSHREIIKEMYFKGSTDAEFEAFMMLCKKTGLDPIAKQIYVMKTGGRMVTLVSIDGLRLVAERSGRYAPGREPTYTYNQDGKLISATAYVKKQTQDGSWHEVASSAHLAEFEKKSSPIWKDMPHVMLAKCAEAQALRRAFPNDLSGLYAKEELEQAEVEEKKPKLMAKPETVEAKVQEVAPNAQKQPTINDLLLACMNAGIVVDDVTLGDFVRNSASTHDSTEELVIQTALSSDTMLARFGKGLLKFMTENPA